MTFEDVAVRFSGGEWRRLTRAQRRLYAAVMLDNYGLVVSLGKDVPAGLRAVCSPLPSVALLGDGCRAPDPALSPSKTVSKAGAVPRGLPLCLLRTLP